MEAAIQERQRAIEERQQAIAEQQRSLRGRWGEDSNADTENLRKQAAADVAAAKAAAARRNPETICCSEPALRPISVRVRRLSAPKM